MIAPPKPPSQDELEALIKEARARQLRRRLLGAAGVAVAAGLGLSVYALTIGGNPGNLAQGLANAGRETGPACRTSQLAATLGFQGATQTLVGGAEIENLSKRACSLPSRWPRVRLWSDGKRLPVVQRRPPGYRRFPEKPVHVLAPGQRAGIEMQWANWCGGRPAQKERFETRLGSGLAVAADTTVAPPCLAAQRPSILIVDRVRQGS